MAHATDTLLARYVNEIEEKQKVMDSVVEAAQKEGRDLDDREMELLGNARERMKSLEAQMGPLEEARRISGDSQERLARIAEQMAKNGEEKPKEVKYRSAGEYVLDRWQAGLGHQTAIQRLDLYHRAAAHQTTADNPGLIPEQILGPVVSFVDAARPIVTAIGVRQLPSGSWSRPRITQHTQVGEQAAEKTELVSRKMVIGTVPVSATTYGGYVNISRQNIDWSQPAIMDIVINDLAAQYAIETETAAADTLSTGATAGPTIAAGATGEEVAAALWEAAGTAFAATAGQGRLIALVSADVLGLLGPLFPPINPNDAQGAGFSAASFGSGVMGSVGAIPVVMSSALADGTLLLVSTAAVECYEDRIGPLQVVEPSVLGVQVAYAGYFAELLLEAGGVIEVTVS